MHRNSTQSLYRVYNFTSFGKLSYIIFLTFVILILAYRHSQKHDKKKKSDTSTRISVETQSDYDCEIPDVLDV